MGKRGIDLFLILDPPPQLFPVRDHFSAHPFKGPAQFSHLVPAVIGNLKIQILSPHLRRAVFQNLARTPEPHPVKEDSRTDCPAAGKDPRRCI